MIFIPFNHQPFSVSVKTASYTIPASFYARTTVECDSGGTFTIDTVTAVDTDPFVNINQSGVNLVALTHTVPTGYMSKVTAMDNNGAETISINANGAQALAANIYSEKYEIGPAGTATISPPAGTGNVFLQGVSIPSNATNRQAVFWLPTGTVINGTGNWKAVVELYPMIS